MMSGKAYVAALAVVLLFSTIFMWASNNSAERAVDYALDISDPPGDPTGMNVVGEFKDNSDILSIHTSESSGILTFQMTVKGTIHSYSDGGEMYTYSFYRCDIYA